MSTFDGIGPTETFHFGSGRTGRVDQWERVASDRDPLEGYDWTGLGDYRAASASTGGNGEHVSGHYKTTQITIIIIIYYYPFSPSHLLHANSNASDNSSPGSFRLSLRPTLVQETQIISSRLSRRRLPPRMLRRRRPR